MNYDFLIVGAGLTGAVFAERLASRGKKILVVDKRPHIAGNCYDYIHNGVHIHAYGPHAFHTNNSQVWQYLSRFTDWHGYMHRVLASIDGILVPIPFNFNSIYMLFPTLTARSLEKKLTENYAYGSSVPIASLNSTDDKDLKMLADFIYEKVFKHYTMKQWGKTLEELDPSVGARVPVNISRDDRYFTDTYQAIPANGYTEMIRRILRHENIEVKTNTDYADMKNSVNYAKLIYTGAIDSFFGYKHGELPYRSLRFKLYNTGVSRFQAAAQVNYPNNYDYTRITECSHFLNEKTDDSVIMEEYPEAYIYGENEPYYPVACAESAEMYELYRAETSELENVIFAGRLGWYKYYNMDSAVERALLEADSLT